MIRVGIFILLVCAAIYAGPYLADNQGFVHIAAGNYVVETSLTVAVVLALVVLAVLFGLYKLGTYCVSVPRGAFRWASGRTGHRLQRTLDGAVIAFHEGDYGRTLELLGRVGRPEALPLGHLFIAARSAFELRRIDDVRSFLECAARSHRNASEAINVLRAQLNLELGNVGVSQEYLSQVRTPNALTKKLSYDCLRARGDVEELYRASPRLLASSVISAEEGRDIQLAYVRKMLGQAGSTGEIQELYKNVSHTSQDMALACPVIMALAERGDLDAVRKLTLRLLRENPDSQELLECIAGWEQSIPEVLDFLRGRAQENLIASEVNVPLLTALGNLELQSGLLDDARIHFEKALELSKSRALYLKLGHLLAMQQQYAKSNDYLMRASHPDSA